MPGSRLLVLAAICGAIVVDPAVDIGAALGESSVDRGGRTVVEQQRPGEEQSGRRGLVFRLSEGSAAGAPALEITAPPSLPLGEAETRALIERLPPIAAADLARPFAFPARTLPAPRAGKTVSVAFPPPDEGSGGAPAVVSGALHVLRRSPEGEVPLAPNLSVTFDQPMVALTSHDALAKTPVPVTLSPQPPGEWRWVGAKTVVFEPADRFPMATEYTVEVPAGTKSATGGAIATAERWSFATPPPVLVESHPESGPARHLPILFAAFDQRIDPAAVLAVIGVRAGTVAPRLRLATLAEVNADEAVRRMAERALPGRWLAFTTVESLPAASKVTVTVGAGAPSAEGPRRTTKPEAWSFETYGPMRVVLHQEKIEPWAGTGIRFTNPIDRRAFRKEMVRVAPEVSRVRVEVHGDSILVGGAFRPNTRYTVTVSAGLRDEFGQTLGRDERLAFSAGPARPLFQAPGAPFVVLEPAGPPVYSVVTTGYTGIEVTAHAVAPADWEAFCLALRGQNDGRQDTTVPGRRLFTRDLRITGSLDEPVETRIDLSTALPAGVGQVVLQIEATGATDASAETRRFRRPGRGIALVWVQATRLALEAFADADQLLAYASRLDDGRPLAGVELALLPSGAKARTGPDGLARLPLTGTAASILVGRSGSDVVLLPESPGPWGSGWQRRERRNELRWFVFDDRGIYRPGERARFKGWVRAHTPGPAGDVTRTGEGTTVVYRMVDARGNEIGKGRVATNRWGAFDLAFEPPAGVNLGAATLELTCAVPGMHEDSTRFSHRFQIQEFRTPEYEVKAEASSGPHVVGGHATVTVSAAYYAGGALPGADVRWDVETSPGHFTPPNRGDFVFGRWTPWWARGGSDGDPGNREESFAGTTDGSGRHAVRIDFDRVTPPRPTMVSAHAVVQDVNRQAWSAGATLLVHPADRYVGVRLRKPFVRVGEVIAPDLIVTDLDGIAMPGRPIEVRAERLEWEQEGGEWVERRVGRQDCRVTSGAEPVPCSFTPDEGGQYELTASIRDDGGRPNETVVRVWVAGGKRPAARRLEREEVTLIPDRERYRPGDTAEVLVVAPFAPAEGVMTLQREGLLRSERFSVTDATATLKVAIEEAWLPGVWLHVELVGRQVRDGADGVPDSSLPPRPARASGSVALAISTASRELSVNASARATALEPGGNTTIDAVVRRADGKPAVGVEVAVVVADEAVLSLTGYRSPAPLETFYRPSPDGVEVRSLRDHVVIATPTSALESVVNRTEYATVDSLGVAESAGARGGMPVPPSPMAMRAGGAGTEAAPIRARSDFNPLALFVASAETDASGRVSVPLELPDNLTRYRVMVVAADDTNRFGSGESTVTARLPLMARVSPPRFLNFGDRFELPVVVQNQTDRPMPVDVAVRAANLEFTDGAGRRVDVPANDRVEVRFPARARQAGKARVQVAAASGQWSDAAEVTLPVWTPATTEAFATYGEIDEGAVVQPLSPPTGVVPDFGGLEITTSSTALQALTDAVLYLVAYPFECAEQLSSRILAIAALRDVLAAFEAEGLPPAAEIEAAVARDLTRLRALQNEDGGFGFWRRGDESWPYLGIHAAHALARAKARGYEVPADTLERAHGYLKQIERHIPARYDEEARRTLVAYALHVRALLGDRDVARARRLIREATLPKLSFEAVGWLLGVLAGDAGSAGEVAEIRRLLANRVTETAGAAHFAVAYAESDYLLLRSDRRADAVVLEALITADAKSDLIPKLVAGLLAHRKAGRWSNTQENAFVLLALDRYFRTYEAVTPDFVARVWLGDRFAGEQAFRGRSTDRAHLEIPMRALVDAAGGTSRTPSRGAAAVGAGVAGPRVTLAKEGAGRLYYRMGLRYAPDDLRLSPLDRGFVVQRRYEAVDDPGDVVREADGGWRIRAGARVRVRVTLVAEARRYHVALVDPLPAGLEILNPELKTTGPLPPATPRTTVAEIGAPGLGGPGRGGAWWWWRRAWYEHDNLRDDRAEAFASLLWEGVYTYTYVARATTPGVFVVPPPRAEEMYAPETFGRGASDIVTVR